MVLAEAEQPEQHWTETLVLQTTQFLGPRPRPAGRVGQKALLHLFTHLSVLFPEFSTPDWPNRADLYGHGREDEDRRLGGDVDSAGPGRS